MNRMPNVGPEVPLYVPLAALEDMADALRDHLVVVQDPERRRALERALEVTDDTRFRLITNRIGTKPDLQPQESFPQRMPGWPLAS